MKLWEANKTREVMNSRTHEEILIEDYIAKEIKQAAKGGLERVVLYFPETPDSTKRRISDILNQNGYKVDEHGCALTIRW